MQEIQRDITERIWQHLQKKEISLIVGPRQVGKTTLMRSIKKRLEAEGKKTLFLNLDVEMDARFFVSQETLLQKIRLEIGHTGGYVFIDEIQKKENAGVFLKGIYDLDLPYKYIISGSGSLELKEKIHESLAGRKRVFEMTSVTWSEWMQFRTGYRYMDTFQMYCQLHHDEVLRALMEYLNYGGYPRVILEDTHHEKQSILDEIYQSYLIQDIGYLLRIEKNTAFTKLIQILATQTGQLIRYSELAKQIGVAEVTVKNYLYYAEHTFAIQRVLPFFVNKQKEIIKSPTVYFYDIGLRNHVLGQMGQLHLQQDFGFVFQNLIYLMLREKYLFTATEIKFWRTTDQAEVDFIIDQGSARIPVEVKYRSLQGSEIERSMRSFIEKYQPSEAWIVNLTYTGEISIGDTRVRFIPFYALVEQKSL